MYTIYLYSIPISDKNEEVFLNRENNVFDCYEPQQVFNLGVNGNLSFSQVGADVFLNGRVNLTAVLQARNHTHIILLMAVYILTVQIYGNLHVVASVR